MQWLSDKIDNALAWIANLVADILTALFELLLDIFTYCLEAFLSVISDLLSLIPVPAFIAGGLQTMLNGIDPSVLYFLNAVGFSQALAILGSGLAFRLARKLFTLGQW